MASYTYSGILKAIPSQIANEFLYYYNLFYKELFSFMFFSMQVFKITVNNLWTLKKHGKYPVFLNNLAIPTFVKIWD